MRKFVKLNEKGVTLVELLTTILVSSIILGIIYSVFIMGINYYKKIAIEGQLRDEADYIVSSILTEIYKLSPDEIDDCGIPEGCFSAKNTKKLISENIKASINLYKVKEKNYDNPESVTLRIQGNDLILTKKTLGDSGVLEETEYNLNNDKINIDGSKLAIDCTYKTKDPEENRLICTNATINISLTLKHEDYQDPNGRIYVKPITYKSSIGF